jgi:hypothetical protein
MNSIWSNRRLRFVVAVAATIVTGAAVASAALAGLGALKLGPAAASQYPKKVTVCHRTHSKKHPWVQIRISTHALKAHLRHGDFVVDASNPCPPTGAAAAAAKNKHHGKHSGKGKGKGKSGKNSAQGTAKSGTGGAQAKGKGKSGKSSAPATAKSGKNGAQAGSAEAKEKGKSGAQGKGNSGKNSAPAKGKGKSPKNSAPPKTNHSNGKGGNGHGKK